jgi:hypothetical protein
MDETPVSYREVKGFYRKVEYVEKGETRKRGMYFLTYSTYSTLR